MAARRSSCACREACQPKSIPPAPALGETSAAMTASPREDSTGVILADGRYRHRGGDEDQSPRSGPGPGQEWIVGQSYG